MSDWSHPLHAVIWLKEAESGSSVQEMIDKLPDPPTAEFIVESIRAAVRKYNVIH
jgi:hypothetical protein